jgi:cardiolipin synthase
MIHGARTRIRIQTPYFIPDESIHAALLNAALRGVDVQIMLPRNPDYAYLRWVANTYLEEILRAGGRVFEYVNGFLHPKVILVDDRIATIGTCNIDIRSFRLDFEVNILTSGSKTVRHLLEDFEHDLGNCEEIDYLEFIDRPLGKRIKESVARLIAPLL